MGTMVFQCAVPTPRPLDHSMQLRKLGLQSESAHLEKIVTNILKCAGSNVLVEESMSPLYILVAVYYTAWNTL